MNILVVSHSPSPYQVELFNQVVTEHDGPFRVAYLYGGDPSRSWARVTPRHEYCVLDTAAAREVADRWEEEADFFVANYYRHPAAASLIRKRAARGAPWAFWGERPGFHHPMLGRIERKWSLRPLHRSSAPIWGIGKFAVDAYRDEFGSRRDYVNVPYFSDLQRFVDRSARVPRGGKERTILFSGSLILRKGVDLLARAFARVAESHPHLRLSIMGSGDLEVSLRRAVAPVAQQVTFVGFKDWDELPSIYATADVLCVPSRHDGWGLVVPEGLASGLPVIATSRMGAAVDLLVDGRNGWLVEAGSQAALEQALQEVAGLGDSELRRLGEAASSSIERHSLRHGSARFLAACRSGMASWAR